MEKNAGPLDIIEIPLSRVKIVGLLIGSVLFVLAGIWLVQHPGQFNSAPLLITIVGYIAIALFGVFALFIVNKLFNGGPGFVIDDNGIVDNSATFSVGFIPWEDIVDISVIEISNQKLIMVKVSDPQEYISRQTNAIGRQTASMNYKMYGSPVNISANALKISFKELYDKITQRWQGFKSARGE